MIKSVAQAIPTYTMNCLKLPNNICLEIDRFCANFWWGEARGKKKKHWMSWRKMCNSKDSGGMGFRHIVAFNQVMLVKQCWKIIRNPKSLLHKILRGRYFKNEGFMEASVGKSPSLIWRSICWGRDLFSKGYRWRIGNGRQVRIDKDLWLNRKGNARPIFVNENLKGLRVNHLLDNNNKWKEDIILQGFSHVDIEDILNIPSGRKDTIDEIIWNFDKKGQFSVKSAYHLAMTQSNHNTSSQQSSNDSTRVWKNLWKLKVLPRTKVCVWKIIQDIIPTKNNIAQKGVDLNPICCVCKKKRETTTHLMWECKIPKEGWSKFIPNSYKLFSVCMPTWTTEDYWWWTEDNFSPKELAIGAIILWKTWTLRNRMTANNQGVTEALFY